MLVLVLFQLLLSKSDNMLRGQGYLEIRKINGVVTLKICD